MNTHQNVKPALVWTVAETFVDQESGIYVQVTSCKTYPTSVRIFSMTMGQLVGPEQKPARHIPVFLKRESTTLSSTQPEFQFPLEDIVIHLWRQALAYINQAAFADLAERQAAAYDRDVAKANYDKPKTAHTGKTAKNRAKRTTKSD